ncbi:MAG TPA: DegT/DnrJ/EryC1/StrS aminotransferase family protein [Allosphingosinicella sp.]|jgi:dTDP-4-amino-4,6-dideoxygalactose transaminase
MAALSSRALAPEQERNLAPRADEAWPFYADDEIEAAVSVLRSGKVNQWTGPDVFAFQDACRERFGGGPGIALANGSLALELPLRAFGIGPGDEVVTTPRTFVASAYCAQLVGATPVFAEVDADSGNIDAATIEAVLTERTKAIVPVHIAGWPCDMPAIMSLAERRGIKVIEDCAQAQGATVGGRPVGTFGDAAAFSFCQDKIITTGGEGGYVSFRDEAAWEWAWSFKDHGKSWAKVNTPAAAPGFRWLHDSVGTNWRLTGPQAAIGIAQLRKLAQWTEARGRNAMVWAEALGDVPAIRVPLPGEGFGHAWYKFYAYVPEGAKAERDRILARANAEGIRLFSGSCSEVYLEAAFDDLPRPTLPVARRLGETSLMMEVHPTLRPELTRRRAERVAEIAREVLG